MIVKILEVWIASKIRLRPGRDVGMNALVFGYFLQVTKIDFIIVSCAKSNRAELKVSKFEKQILLFSFEPKNEQKSFLISALASKTGQIKKNDGTLLY